jgi:hypothetical protein
MTPHTPTPSTVAAARMIDGALRHELLNLLSDDRVEAIAKIIDRHSAAPALVEALEAQEEYEQAFNEWSEWSAREDVDPNEWGSINRALREDLNKAEEKAKALRATALAAAKPNEPKG